MALKTTSPPSCLISSTTVEGFNSNAVTLWPLACKASVIAPPVRRDTSASLDGPPINTIICLLIIVFPPIIPRVLDHIG